MTEDDEPFGELDSREAHDYGFFCLMQEEEWPRTRSMARHDAALVRTREHHDEAGTSAAPGCD